jgi:ABC-type molybdate transport system substrate-binding protein
VINGAPAAAEQFAQFMLSPAGQTILIGYGVASVKNRPR